MPLLFLIMIFVIGLALGWYVDCSDFLHLWCGWYAGMSIKIFQTAKNIENKFYK